jgi:hypothetical protein
VVWPPIAGLSESIDARRDDRHPCGQRAARELQLAGEILSLSKDGEIRGAFFSKFNEFHKPPRHPKWSEASLNIKVPGWPCFKAADEWLAEHANATAPATDSGAFDRFLSQNRGTVSNLSPEDKAAFRLRPVPNP